ncbi:MAG: DUF3391 domain-containing protein [Desulfovibrionaceae bacterium]|jgi:putative nucleotidyltransferase with HDIG domain|nr:DUF3391 domain-containing protein [Desulfovibrionaceae bacterium]
MALTEYPISIDQLCEGLYIRLEGLEGRRNPFLRKSFKIKNRAQIDKIRELGLTHVICVLSKSDQLPVPPEKQRGPARRGSRAEPERPKTPVSAEILGLKEETIRKNKERKLAFAKCEKRYDQTVSAVVALLRRASGRAADAVGQASQVVGAMVDTFLAERDVLVNLMSSKPTEEQKNYHALNVTVLAMMLGKEVRLNGKALHVLGMGALFHDIGKGRVPIRSLKGGKATTMDQALQRHYMRHPIEGAELLGEMIDFPRQALPLVQQHHEALNGSGFPKGLSGKDVSPLAQLLAVADQYDNLLNQAGPDRATRTPHEALKAIYARKATLDEKILSLFIRTLGVYPPGCVVKLSNGVIGMVVSTNTARATRPTVLIHHPDIPKKEALMVDLAIETELEIVQNLRPETLSKDVFAYLSPSRQINYYADNAPAGG